MADLPHSLALPLLLPGEEEPRSLEEGAQPPPQTRVPVTQYVAKRRTCLCGEAPIVLDQLFEDSQSRAVSGTLLAYASVHLLLFLLFRYTRLEPPTCPALPALHLSSQTEVRTGAALCLKLFVCERELHFVSRAPSTAPAETHPPQVAQRVLSYVAVTACGLAVHRGNAGDWLLTSRLMSQCAWASLLSLTVLFLLQDLAPCLHWLFSDGRIADVHRVAASALALVDATLLLLLLSALVGASRARETQHVDVRTITPAYSPFSRRRSTAARDSGGGLLGHWWRMLQVAPLRHTVSVAVSLTVFTMLTVVLCVLAVVVRRKVNISMDRAIQNWDSWVQQLETIVSANSTVPPPPTPPPPALSPASPSDGGGGGGDDTDMRDVLTAILEAARGVGDASLRWVKLCLDSLLDCTGPAAVLSLLCLVVCFKRSFDLIWLDHERIRRRFPLPAAPPTFAVTDDGALWAEHPWTEHAESPQSPLSATLSPPLPQAMPATPAGPSPAYAGLQPERVRAGRFSSDGALDLADGSFQFVNASAYMPGMLVNVLFSYVSLTLVLLMLLFCFRFPPTRKWALLTLLGAPAARVALRKLGNLCLSCCVVRNSSVYAPRTLVWLDLLLTFSFGSLIGVSSAVTRFLCGCIHLLGRLVIFPVSILPDQLSFLDSGFGSYGAAMKGRYHSALEEEAAPAAGRRSRWSQQPGSLTIF